MQIESFTSSFPMRILFISFSSLKGVARIPKTSSDEYGHPNLNADFKGNVLSFSLLTMMFAVVLSYLAFIMLRHVSSMTTLAEFSFFIKKKKTLNFIEFKFEFGAVYLQIICVSSIFFFCI